MGFFPLRQLYLLRCSSRKRKATAKVGAEGMQGEEQAAARRRVVQPTRARKVVGGQASSRHGHGHLARRRQCGQVPTAGCVAADQRLLLVLQTPGKDARSPSKIPPGQAALRLLEPSHDAASKKHLFLKQYYQQEASLYM